MDQHYDGLEQCTHKNRLLVLKEGKRIKDAMVMAVGHLCMALSVVRKNAEQEQYYSSGINSSDHESYAEDDNHDEMIQVLGQRPVLPWQMPQRQTLWQPQCTHMKQQYTCDTAKNNKKLLPMTFRKHSNMVQTLEKENMDANNWNVLVFELSLMAKTTIK